MSKKVIVEGRALIVPDDATPDEIDELAGSARKAPASMMETIAHRSGLQGAVNWLPEIAGAAGGLIGGVGGAAAGGIGAVPGAVAGAVLGGSAGEAARQMIRRATGGPAPTDPDEAAKAIMLQGGVQGGAELLGAGIGAGVAKAGPALMQSAVKPTLATLKEFRTTAPKVARTLLEEGIQVTAGGLGKLQKLLDSTNAEIADLVANAAGTIPKDRVAARVLPTAKRVSQQTNPTADLKAVGATVDEFLHHPINTGPLTIPEAHAMKVGTYQRIGKKYGQLSSAHIETEKALARGLKEEVADAVPGVAALNKKDAELMAAADSVARRISVAGNRDPVGFAWVTSNPTTFIAALMDRHPAVKSMLANAMWKSAGAATGASPQVIRAAVHALLTDESADAPGPQ